MDKVIVRGSDTRSRLSTDAYNPYIRDNKRPRIALSMRGLWESMVAMTNLVSCTV